MLIFSQPATLRPSPSCSLKIGSAADDAFEAAVTHQDGSVVLAGHQNLDFYVTKLDAEGTLEWSFEVKLTSGWVVVSPKPLAPWHASFWARATQWLVRVSEHNVRRGHPHFSDFRQICCRAKRWPRFLMEKRQSVFRSCLAP